MFMVNVPGSLDDDTNQDPGRALRGARLNTRINSGGIMESGGADLFLAGIERVVHNGARIGVNHIDGGAGEDSIRFAGRKSEYTISRRGGELTVVDSYYERNGIAVLTNVERLEFRQTGDAAE